MKRIVLYVIVLSGILFTGCDKKQKTTNVEPLPVEVAKPVVKDVTLTRDYPGYLTAETSIDVVGRVNGTLLSKN